jgi:non-homologous end joining protein Ku
LRLEQGLVGTLLRYPCEVRPEAKYFDDIEDVRLTKDMLESRQAHRQLEVGGLRAGAIRGPL